MNHRTAVAAVAFVAASLGVRLASADEPPQFDPEDRIVGGLPDAPAQVAKPDAFVAAAGEAPLAPRPVSAPDAATRPKSVALMYAGLGTGVAGVALFITGVAMKSERPPCRGSEAVVIPGPCLAGEGAADVWNFEKGALMVIGGAMTAGGVAMTMVGAWRVPLNAPLRPTRGQPAAKPVTTATITGGPSSVQLRVSF